MQSNDPLPEAWRKLVETRWPQGLSYDNWKAEFSRHYQNWDSKRLGPAPAWVPAPSEVSQTNLAAALKDLGLNSYQDLHRWSVNHRAEFWAYAIKRLGIDFGEQSKVVRTDTWYPNACSNIASFCFQAPPTKTAIVFQAEGGELNSWTYGQLKQKSEQVAASLVKQGIVPGDAVAIAMTMTPEAVAIYLGIVLMGGAVVSIADSFAPDEIEARLRIAGAKLVFTQDFVVRAGKHLPMYEKVQKASPVRTVVLASGPENPLPLRNSDLAWEEFLVPTSGFAPHLQRLSQPTNILFSSGTTGDPKAIPWTHLTPLKCAVDAHFHQDVHTTDVLAWPTNLGWMMGPWLVYATLLNGACMALYGGAPTGRDFGTFVVRARVTILGLVPSIVKAWRSSGCMAGLDWSALRLFSSTGECSNSDDYFFLMSLAKFAPVIEYCGGTEIGGGYLTGTLLQPAAPATFTTAALGLDFVIVDEDGTAADSGELFLVPPSIGLSETLLNKDHDAVYYQDTPQLAAFQGIRLRRHGDQVERLPGGFLRALGRADDTMNLGGIKVSSAEIERTIQTLPWLRDCAAIAVNPPGGGPSLLVICAVLSDTAPQAEEQLLLINRVLKEKLNPLFRAERVVSFAQLPRTASNKVLRRVLRQELGRKL